MENALRLEEPAILVWLPVGQAPTDNDFVLTEGKQPHIGRGMHSSIGQDRQISS
jgi:hypothetical protein